MPAGFPLSFPTFSSCNIVPPFSAGLQDSQWWGAGGGFSTEQVHTPGGTSVKVNSAVYSFAGFDFMPGTFIDVEPGQRFTATVWVYPLSQIGTLDFTAWWADTTGVLPASGTSFHPGAASGTVFTDAVDWQIPCPPANQWTKIGGGTVTVPPGYDQMEVYFEANDVLGLTIYVADPVVCPVAPPPGPPDPFIIPALLGDLPVDPVITDRQVISIHTKTGAQLYQYLPEHYADSTWTRTLRDVSSATLTLPPQPGETTMPDIVDWAHWATIYDGDRGTILWRGPIQKVTFNPRTGLVLEVKDPAAYLSRTRNPITKRWDAIDPAVVAGELWEAMLDLQNIDAAPIVRPDPEGDRFDYQVIRDAQMLDQTISELVSLGMKWTMVSGAPIIGPVSLKPVAVLHESDFLGDGVNLVRDGSATFNDVLVRGPDNLANERVDYYGENLQTIANIDSMFGVSNVTRAAQQYLRHTGSVRTRLELPASTVLHPNAPVNIDQLMPSARFMVEAHGIQQLMELTGVSVDRRQGAASVSVTMETVEPELELTDKKQGPQTTLGGQSL